LFSYKSGFAFPLFTEIFKQDQVYNYLITITDYRGGIDFLIRRCFEEKVKRSVYHDPYENEFSPENIRYFISYFCGYLLGIWQVISKENLTPFYHDITANHIVYGYCEQEGCFEFEYGEDEERYTFLSNLGFLNRDLT